MSQLVSSICIHIPLPRPLNFRLVCKNVYLIFFSHWIWEKNYIIKIWDAWSACNHSTIVLVFCLGTLCYHNRVKRDMKHSMGLAELRLKNKKKKTLTADHFYHDSLPNLDNYNSLLTDPLFLSHINSSESGPFKVHIRPHQSSARTPPNDSSLHWK